eukprot:6184261-Pleurochrysis_carterae.AAC.3
MSLTMLTMLLYSVVGASASTIGRIGYAAQHTGQAISASSVLHASSLRSSRQARMMAKLATKETPTPGDAWFNAALDVRPSKAAAPQLEAMRKDAAALVTTIRRPGRKDEVRSIHCFREALLPR